MSHTYTMSGAALGSRPGHVARLRHQKARRYTFVELPTCSHTHLSHRVHTRDLFSIEQGRSGTPHGRRADSSSLPAHHPLLKGARDRRLGTKSRHTRQAPNSPEKKKPTSVPKLCPFEPFGETQDVSGWESGRYFWNYF